MTSLQLLRYLVPSTNFLIVRVRITCSGPPFHSARSPVWSEPSPSLPPDQSYLQRQPSLSLSSNDGTGLPLPSTNFLIVRVRITCSGPPFRSARSPVWSEPSPSLPPDQSYLQRQPSLSLSLSLSLSSNDGTGLRVAFEALVSLQSLSA